MSNGGRNRVDPFWLAVADYNTGQTGETCDYLDRRVRKHVDDATQGESYDYQIHRGDTAVATITDADGLGTGSSPRTRQRQPLRRRRRRNSGPFRRTGWCRFRWRSTG